VRNGLVRLFVLVSLAAGCSPSLRIHKRVGSVRLTIDGVSHETLAYGASANHDPDGDSDGTTVAKP
jgi:hypothetical protein